MGKALTEIENLPELREWASNNPLPSFDLAAEIARANEQYFNDTEGYIAAVNAARFANALNNVQDDGDREAGWARRWEREHAEGRAPRFPEVFCSQCGGAFPARDSGYSHCEDHKGVARHD